MVLILGNTALRGMKEQTNSLGRGYKYHFWDQKVRKALGTCAVGKALGVSALGKDYFKKDLKKEMESNNHDTVVTCQAIGKQRRCLGLQQEEVLICLN